MRALLMALVLVSCSPSEPPILPYPGAYQPDASGGADVPPAGATPGDHCGLPAEWMLGSWGDCPGKAGPDVWCSFMCIAQIDGTGSRYRVAACLIDGHLCVGQFASDCASCP